MDDEEYLYSARVSWVMFWSFVLPAAGAVLIVLIYGYAPLLIPVGICNMLEGLDVCKAQRSYFGHTLRGPFGLPIDKIVGGMMCLAFEMMLVMAELWEDHEFNKRTRLRYRSDLSSETKAYAVIRVVYFLSPEVQEEYARYLKEKRTLWAESGHGRLHIGVLTYYSVTLWFLTECGFIAPRP